MEIEVFNAESSVIEVSQFELERQIAQNLRSGPEQSLVLALHPGVHVGPGPLAIDSIRIPPGESVLVAANFAPWDWAGGQPPAGDIKEATIFTDLEIGNPQNTVTRRERIRWEGRVVSSSPSR
jgi:hypothetical protein